MDKRGTDPFRVSAELRANYIETARDKILQEHFELLLQHDAKGQPMAKPVTFTSTGETHGIVLVEGPGGGKTSLVHHFLKTHPALQSEEPGHKPWIGVRVPSPATLKSLGLEILRATGYPEVSSKRKEWDIWRLVRFRMQQLGTAVLWIDEAHDLFRAGKAIEDILKMLKSVMQGEGAVIVILTGIDSCGTSHPTTIRSKGAIPRSRCPQSLRALTKRCCGVLWKSSAKTRVSFRMPGRISSIGLSMRAAPGSVAASRTSLPQSKRPSGRAMGSLRRSISRIRGRCRRASCPARTFSCLHGGPKSTSPNSTKPREVHVHGNALTSHRP